MGQIESKSKSIIKQKEGKRDYNSNISSSKSTSTTNNAAGLNNVLLMMDQYPIKLTAQQCVQLYGLLSTKQRILRWSDIIETGSEITFRSCVNAKIDIQKLYNMQKDLQEWIQYKKVTIEDCSDLALWCPHPFLDFQCHIGDLVVRKHIITHKVLVSGGVTFEDLWTRFGMTPSIMIMIRYTPEQWIDLGLQETHVAEIGDEFWVAIFKDKSKKHIIEGIQRRKQYVIGPKKQLQSPNQRLLDENPKKFNPTLNTTTTTTNSKVHQQPRMR